MDKDLSDKLDILIKNTSTPKFSKRILHSFSGGIFYSLGIFFTTSFLIGIIIYLVTKSPLYPYIAPYLKLK